MNAIIDQTKCCTLTDHLPSLLDRSNSEMMPCFQVKNQNPLNRLTPIPPLPARGMKTVSDALDLSSLPEFLAVETLCWVIVAIKYYLIMAAENAKFSPVALAALCSFQATKEFGPGSCSLCVCTQNETRVTWEQLNTELATDIPCNVWC